MGYRTQLYTEKALYTCVLRSCILVFWLHGSLLELLLNCSNGIVSIDRLLLVMYTRRKVEIYNGSVCVLSLCPQSVSSLMYRIHFFLVFWSWAHLYYMFNFIRLASSESHTYLCIMLSTTQFRLNHKSVIILLKNVKLWVISRFMLFATADLPVNLIIMIHHVERIE